MKVIGKISEREYICTVGHTELEKFLGLYYNGNGLRYLTIGEDVDLDKGYDHSRDIAEAMRTTQQLIKTHQPVVTAILNGLRIQAMIDANPTPPPKQ